MVIKSRHKNTGYYKVGGTIEKHGTIGNIHHWMDATDTYKYNTSKIFTEISLSHNACFISHVMKLHFGEIRVVFNEFDVEISELWDFQLNTNEQACA